MCVLFNLTPGHQADLAAPVHGSCHRNQPFAFHIAQAAHFHTRLSKPSLGLSPSNHLFALGNFSDTLNVSHCMRACP